VKNEENKAEKLTFHFASNKPHGEHFVNKIRTKYKLYNQNQHEQETLQFALYFRLFFYHRKTFIIVLCLLFVIYFFYL
jgi:hypothetical protein